MPLITVTVNMENLKLYKKLLAVQAEIKPIKKEEKNTAFGGFLYYDINSLLAEIKPILTKHGLILIQAIGNHEGTPNLVTTVIDAESGEKMQSDTPLTPIGDAQKFGGLVTYMRRYTLTALFALEAEDDDGNVASATQASKAQPSSVKSVSSSAGTPKAICAKCGAPMIHNPKTGRDFCQEKCWLKPVEIEPIPAQYPEDIPFA